MKKLKQDTINYSKMVFSKFIPIPFIAILFVICYCAILFVKFFTIDGASLSVIDLIKQGGSMLYFSVLYALPQAAVLISFITALVSVIRKKAFNMLDLSESVGGIFYFIALYSVVFVASSSMLDGGLDYINWIILIPIIYISVNVVISLICCFISGKVKLPISIIINYCIRILLFAILIMLLANISFMQDGEDAVTIIYKGQPVIFNAEIVETLMSQGAFKFIFVWGTTILIAIILMNIVSCLSKIIQAYKVALLLNNKDYVKEIMGSELSEDIDEYMNKPETQLKLEGALIESCREDLSMGKAVILVVIGVALFVSRMEFVTGSDSPYLEIFAMFSNAPTITCLAILLVGVAVIISHFVTKRITYRRLVKIEELTDTADGKEINAEK